MAFNKLSLDTVDLKSKRVLIRYVHQIYLVSLLSVLLIRPFLLLYLQSGF